MPDPKTLLFVGDDRDTRIALEAFLPPEITLARAEDFAGARTYLLRGTRYSVPHLIAYGPDVVLGFVPDVDHPPSAWAWESQIVLVEGPPEPAVSVGAEILECDVVSLPEDWPVLLSRLGADQATSGRGGTG